MKKPLLSLGLGLVSSFVTSTAFAVQSAPITENSKVKWSQVIEDPFDGAVVYDKHFANNFTFVSSWSKQGIRATYTQKKSILTGYRTAWVTQWVPEYNCKRKTERKKDDDCKHKQRLESYPTQEPVFQTFYTDHVPRTILFAIAGKIYTYESGSVAPELASALPAAPNENMRIRLEWQDGRTTDMEIGKGTVRAWRTIFSSQK
ncbi:MAG: hypothetical protein KME13_18035 [Myxacorys californica WJT36-NPBG1]|jgi:hypothetical protein|nr:hypothetical protein [Myxacorys californica WJT36-NPBG1]